MPVVPRYQPQAAPRVAPSARYAANASPDDFGAGLGQAVQSVATDAAQIGFRLQAEADATAVRSAERELRDWQNKALFGDRKAGVDGAYDVRGQEALALPDRVMGDYDRQHGALRERLNDRQKRLFDERTTTWRSSIEGDVLRHAGREFEAFQRSETRAYVATAGETAVLHWNRPQEVDTQIRVAQEALRSSPDLRGAPPEAVAQAMRGVESAILLDVGRKILDETPLAAAEWFSANRERMTADHQQALDRELEAGTLLGEIQRQTDAIVLQHSDLGAALGAAREIDDPQVRKGVEAEVKMRFAEQRAIDEERQRRATDEAYTYAASGKTPPLSVLRAMDPRDRDALQERLRNRYEAKEPETDNETYADLTELSIRSPTEFARMDLRRYANQLSPSAFRHFLDKQSALGKPDSDKALETITVAQQVGQMADQLNLKDKAQRGRYEAQVHEALRAETVRKGTALTQEERQRVIDDQVIAGTVPGYFGDREKRRFELEPDDRFRDGEDRWRSGLPIGYAEIPIEHRTAISSVLQSMGIDPTPQAVAREYFAKYDRRGPRSR